MSQKNTSEKKVSVIIPVYKVEKYLDKCVESVVNQLYKNLEIILVDDGSPDNCPQICDEWVKKDKRIKVIHKQNGGVSSARNDGMKKATGEFITFIDSDDYVLENFSDFLTYSTNQDCDIVVSNLLGKGRFLENKKYSVLTEKELVCLVKNDIPISCCGKLFKREFLIKNGLLLSGGIYGEDLEWSMRTYLKMNSLSIWASDYYHYEYTESSVSLRMEYKHYASLVDNIKLIFKNIDLSSLSKKAKKKLKSKVIRGFYCEILIISKLPKLESVKLLELINSNKQLLICPDSLKSKIGFIMIKLFGLKIASKIFFKVFPK